MEDMARQFRGDGVTDRQNCHLSCGAEDALHTWGLSHDARLSSSLFLPLGVNPEGAFEWLATHDFGGEIVDLLFSRERTNAEGRCRAMSYSAQWKAARERRTHRAVLASSAKW
jgi:hypothetical protein